jgi:hypothetical protein
MKDETNSGNWRPLRFLTEWRVLGGEPRLAEVPGLAGLRPRLLQQKPEVGALAARRHLAGPFRGVVRLALGIVAVPVRGEVAPAGSGRRGRCALLPVRRGRGGGLVGAASVHRVRALRLRPACDFYLSVCTCTLSLPAYSKIRFKSVHIGDRWQLRTLKRAFA